MKRLKDDPTRLSIFLTPISSGHFGSSAAFLCPEEARKSQFSLTESQTERFSEGGVMAGGQRPAISRSQCTGSGSACAAVFIQDSCIYTGSGVHQWTARRGSTNTDVMLLPRKPPFQRIILDVHPEVAQIGYWTQEIHRNICITST